MTIYLTPLGRVEVQQGEGQSLKNFSNQFLTKRNRGGNEASHFVKNYWSRYGSLIFLKFRSILLKSAHDIRVANMEYLFLNKIHS
jgi:hypothetical protein